MEFRWEMELVRKNKLPTFGVLTGSLKYLNEKVILVLMAMLLSPIILS